ncbi:helix-turn-helix domain-containing protein [Actinoallomurus sp. CA-142502]|uniref:helix-turn-helix domain-containing protein n=1 Tax=Actinoallomurus sp. CA-142502 TaxID=3239885 RepID=UPI003D8A9B6E
MTARATTGYHLGVDQRARRGDPLRPVELDILRQLADGAHDPEIAHALDISTRTYRRYVTAMQHKLGARTRAHAVAIGMRDHHIDPHEGHPR